MSDATPKSGPLIATDSPTPGTPGTPGSRERDLIAQARAAASPVRRGDSSVVSSPIPLPQNFPGLEVLKEIHRGGQGVVYQAIQKTTKRKVAIKVFHEGPFASARDRARFEREVDILATLEHPNVVGIIDRGVTDSGSFFYVMDYVSGKTLDAFIADESRPIDEVLRLFAKVCEAVNAAHLRGIIHRDIKPANIRVDTEGEPRILDFGLAKVAASEVIDAGDQRLMTMTGQFVGSLPWASPEQASGGSGGVDVRTDVYSLGVVLYQMLTGGRFPYAVIGNMRDVLDNILRAEPARPSTIRRQINDEVETIVLKALSKDRERRYQSAGDLGRDIRRYLAGETIEAKRDSGWYVLGKAISRHKTPVGAGIVVAMLTVTSAIGLGILYQQASAARDAARAGEAAALAAREQETKERERAQKNFQAVRDLARTFIFNFNDEVRQLRGSTAARQRILTEAQSYLAKVRDQAGEDPVFLRELAESYDRVGDIQGGLFLPNVGGSSDADAAYANARAIREDLLRRDPNDFALAADLAESMRKTGMVLRRQRKNTEAMEELARSVRQFDAAMAAVPATQADQRRSIERRRMNARLDYADAARRAGEDQTDPARSGVLLEESRRVYTEVQEFWRQTLVASPIDEDGARRLGQAFDDHARAELVLGIAARAAADRAAADDPAAASASLDRAIAFFDTADAVAAKAASEFERLSLAAPASATLRRDLMLAVHNRGEAAMRRGFAHEAAARLLSDDEQARRGAVAMDEHKRALGFFRSALDIAEGLASSDEANLEARRDLAVMLNKVGNQVGNAGDLDEAIGILASSLVVRREIYTTDATQIHRRDLAQGLVKHAQALLARLDRSAVDDEQALVELRLAEQEAAEGVEHLEALVEAGALAPDSAEVMTAAQLLSAVRAAVSERAP